MSPAPRKHGIQAIARAADILRAVEAAPGGISLGDLAVAVALPKSTTHRIVMALAEEQLLSAGGTGPIRLGRGLARLGAATRQTLRDDIRPILEELHREVDETVDLAVRDAGGVRFVDQLPSPHRLRAVSAVGASFPLHCTANGKALLAALPQDAALALLPARLERHTEHTITARTALLEELERVRAAGVAFDREEHTLGISAVGAAVLDAAGVAAVISVPVPTSRFAGDEARYADAVRRAAERATVLLRG